MSPTLSQSTMTKMTMMNWFVAAALMVCATLALAAANPGEKAPVFFAPDVEGKAHRLETHLGKFVVIEWVNPNCPFVQKHYSSHNMQNLQKQWTDKGVVWLSINSTNPQHVDYLSPAAMAKFSKDQGMSMTALLMDSSSDMARLYAAKTTPHMFVIDPKGVVVYAGGIDDKRSARVEDVKTAKNFVSAALSEAMAGKAVSVSSATPYGCTVKYGSR